MKIYIIYKSYRDNYINHQMIKELFPGPGKVLFQNKGSKLLVITNINMNVKFDNDPLIEYVGDLNDHMEKLNGNVLFSIRLNSCKKIRGKRFTVLDADVNDWVDNKLLNIGASVVSKNIKKEGILISRRQNKNCYHSSLLVSGIMKIDDKETFKQTVKNGLGGGKAFGFGLLNIFV